MRRKSAASLIHALRMGDEIGADGVVVHPGSTVGEPHDEALPRVGEMVEHALAESDSCRLLLENTAGAGNTLGRSFEELRELIDLVRRRQAHRHLPRLLPHARQRLRHPHGRQAHRGARRLRQARRHAAAALPAPERLAGAARLQPRPPRAARRRRARPARLRGVPLGAALREAAGRCSRAPAWRARRRRRWTSTGCASCARNGLRSRKRRRLARPAAIVATRAREHARRRARRVLLQRGCRGRAAPRCAGARGRWRRSGRHERARAAALTDPVARRAA